MCRNVLSFAAILQCTERSALSSQLAGAHQQASYCHVSGARALRMEHSALQMKINDAAPSVYYNTRGQLLSTGHEEDQHFTQEDWHASAVCLVLGRRHNDRRCGVCRSEALHPRRAEAGALHQALHGEGGSGASPPQQGSCVSSGSGWRAQSLPLPMPGTRSSSRTIRRS